MNLNVKKIDLKERNKKLTNKCHELELKYNKFKNAFYSLLNFQLDSKIVQDPDDLVFLRKCFNTYYQMAKNFSFQLLYRATRDGDTGEKFHELCDNKEGGILILYHTDKNIIFGGFSTAKWISFFNPEKKIDGRGYNGNVNFLFQLNNKKIYNLRVPQEPEKVCAIYCRKDCGPCFGKTGEDIWCRTAFLTKRGKLHKDKEKGRKCSFDIQIDYELNNGEPDFQLIELEAFLLHIN